ncbi:winged helix DNA-binding protein [Streptomyces sp. NPDC007863]|uniref:winged helix DNA-binding protein n=1 Tax=Streptomyces sp. NPDC007863 TaxID=3154894 RepID=UPI0033FE002B
MERPVVSGTACDASGAKFTVVGISNTPTTDWAQVFRALAGTDLTLAGDVAALAADPGASAPGPGSAPGTAPGTASGHAERPGAAPAGPPRLSMTPPSVLNLNAYLMYAIGKAARRRLTERLAAHNLRLWHLTVMAMVADLGPQMKTLLAARLDMNSSDLVKIVNDLVRTGHVDCARDPGNRRRILVRLTPEGRAYLDLLNADIASTDDEVLAPLSASEREVLASLLRRVHHHLDPGPAGTVHHEPERFTEVLRNGSDEDGRIDWTRSAEEIAGFVEARRPLRPHAFTHHAGRRLDVLTATVSRGLYSGEPGHIRHHEDEGVVVVAGADHLGGGRPGLVLHRVRNEHGAEFRAEEYFTPGTTGGHDPR